MGWVNLRETNFLRLPTAVFCVECELISENSTAACLACGSKAVVSLSRILGGSLQGQQTAHVIADAELDRIVHGLLQSVPSTVTGEQRISPAFATLAPSRHHARAMAASDGTYASASRIEPGELDLEPAISVIAERAQALTGATGSAIALRAGNEIVCRARTGRTAPDLGVRLQTDSGISAECVRTGEVVICNDAERNHRVDLSICRRLGVRSILAAPLRHYRQTLGVFEVLSSAPYAFDGRDIATMQLLSSTMVAAMSRLSNMRR